jgi:hypothetical protein
MIEKRIRRVFDAMRESEVSCLLMGGQACILYGAAEFSKNIDFVILAEPDNLNRVASAMSSLQAEVIAVPPFKSAHLEEGLAVHFRCHAQGVDVMTRMRGVDAFPRLWERRLELDDGEGGILNVLHITDLVSAKKTQRDKDWPMIQRLMEVRYLSASRDTDPSDDEIRFWLRELRTPELLIDAAARFPDLAEEASRTRPLLGHAITPDQALLIRSLTDEMLEEKERDRLFWDPLKARLSELRRAKARDIGIR